MNVSAGSAALTVINGGIVCLHKSTIASQTKLVFPGGELAVQEGSVAKDTTIQNGVLHIDATGSASGVTFVPAQADVVMFVYREECECGAGPPIQRQTSCLELLLSGARAPPRRDHRAKGARAIRNEAAPA